MGIVFQSGNVDYWPNSYMWCFKDNVDDDQECTFHHFNPFPSSDATILRFYRGSGRTSPVVIQRTIHIFDLAC
jgi:hypothetical protein